MKIKSVLKPKHVAWVSGALLAAILVHRRLSFGGQSLPRSRRRHPWLRSQPSSREMFPFMENGSELSPGR